MKSFNSRFTRWLSVFLVLALCGTADAWEWTRRQVDRDSLRLGEPLTLSLSVKAQPGEAVRWPLPGKAQLKGWRLLGADSLKDESTADGRQLSRVLALSRYQLGRAPLPELGPAGSDSLSPDSLVVWVVSQLPDSAQPADILEPAALPHSLGWWLGRIAVVLAALGLIAWLWSWWRKRQARPAVEAIIPPDPWRDFEAELERVQQLGLWRVQRTEEHYALLSLALRGLLEDCLGLPCRERSTDELRQVLRDSPLGDGDLAELLRLLEENDWVKYARRWPDPEIAGQQVERYRGWASTHREQLLERHRTLLAQQAGARP